MTYVQASFKNSRIAARKPTTTASTIFKNLVAGAGNTKLLDIDQARTYYTIRNTSAVDNLRYGYSNDPLMTTNGMLLKCGEAADLESPTEVWAINLGGADITVLFDIGRG